MPVSLQNQVRHQQIMSLTMQGGQEQEAEAAGGYQLVNYKVYAKSFGVSVIHQTLTWTTGSLTCVYMIILMRGIIYVHTWVGHTDTESAQHF